MLSNLLFTISILISTAYTHPTIQPRQLSSVLPTHPKSIAITSHTDIITSSHDQNGWKIRYITVEIPVPISLTSSRIGSFYNKLKHLVPGITESTLVAEPRDTVHLGSNGGLWLNIRSDDKVLHSDAISQVLNVLIDGAESGWAPVFEAEYVFWLVRGGGLWGSC